MYAPAMKEIRRSNERGLADHGWLQSRHTFSFADYQDPEHVQFGPLRVINEDRVAPGAGFGTHAHRDMEIVSYVLQGALAHQDSTGSSSVIRPGDVQRMSAGSGVQHSEFNASKTEPVHFLQIWIIPDRVGIAPSYEEKHFTEQDRRGRLCLIASPDRVDGSVLMHQDARNHAGLFDAAEHATFAMEHGRQCYVHVARGALHVAGLHLEPGDGLKITDEEEFELREGRAAEVLLFDLPAKA
jgi:redox-sensitive bicupin YhaK (pirin superfamily)